MNPGEVEMDLRLRIVSVAGGSSYQVTLEELCDEGARLLADGHISVDAAAGQPASDGAGSESNADSVRRIGSELAERWLPANVRQCLVDHVRRGTEFFRLRVQSLGNRYDQLPWEFLHLSELPEGSRFLVLHPVV